MSTPADYSTVELAVALTAALRAADALDGTGLDLVTKWQEEAEARAETIAQELQGRVGESGEEERDRNRALALYDHLLTGGALSIVETGSGPCKTGGQRSSMYFALSY